MNQQTWAEKYKAFGLASDALLAQHRALGQQLLSRSYGTQHFLRVTARLRRRFDESLERIPTP